MKILVDIGHPAHVHFFANPIRKWTKSGFEVLVTSRKKEIATDLLDALKIPHFVLSSLTNGKIMGLAGELVSRDLKLIRIIKKEKPDIMVGIGGVFIAHATLFTRVPSLVFYDTENATLSNLITYPFSSLVTTPNCYKAWLPPWHLKYPGYHELSYLHPEYFTPDRKIAIECGLDPDRKNFLIRTVSWQASHDLAEKGWNVKLLKQTLDLLEKHGKVMISAEGELPEELMKYSYRGAPEKIHHLMGYLTMFIGESATMASECAVLGVPAIYAAYTGRGYTDEQEENYQLVYNVRNLDWPTISSVINEVLEIPADNWKSRREKLLAGTIDVADFVTDLVKNYPESVQKYRSTFSGIKDS